jgi:site-specific DNA-methyltransferase (adenine-specific)
MKGSIPGLKPKDLIGIPWMVAFALRDDGWYLRQDIIWAKACSGNIRKGSAMPESVTDRFQKSHEYIFLLSKSPRYYFDNEAVKEKCVTPDDMQVAKRNKSEHKGQRDPGGRRQTTAGFDKINKVYEFGNRRSVWFVNPKPYKGAHFATYPPKLIEPMILAGCPAGGIVLDPFVGSGTTVMVANHLGRKGIGLDLNFKYLKDNAKERIATVQPIMFN